MGLYVHIRAHMCICMRIYVHLEVGIYVRIRAFRGPVGDTRDAYIRAYTRIHVHIHVYTCIFMHIRAYTCIFVHAHAYACIYVHIHAYTYVYVRIGGYTS